MNKRLVAIGNRSGITIAVRYLVEANEMKAAEAAAERLAVAVRASFIAGPLAAMEAQNRNGREMAQQVDLDATQDAAAGRWGY